MFKRIFSLLILVLMSPLTQAATNCAAVTEIQETECEALIALYNSTNGDSWTNNSGWLETNTPCSWHGVICSGGHVSELNLSSNKLTGTIPTELGNLSNLEYLNLSWNELSGTIPTELGNLSNLKSLYLYGNSLTGSIPTELGNLSNLEYLYLNINSLTGSIPTELGNLSNLTALSLGGNSLAGTIPTELGNLSNLTTLSLGDNSLTGTIPTELGNLSNLESLSLDTNSLTGTIPTELGNLSHLTFLSLSNDELTGTIPTELGNLSNLEYLFLNYNKLTGSIPTELGNLSNLEYLHLRWNDLTGTIPTELGNLSNLESLFLDDNQLTGTIPTELGNLSNLKSLFLYNNQLCEEIPPELKNLSNIPLPDDCYYDSCLDIDNNHLTATDSELIAWLDAHNPGWDETQTPCPQQCKLQFSSDIYSVNENEEQATITVTRTDSNDGAVSIDYATSDDSATAPDDYTQTSGTLNWSDGDDADKTFKIDIINDTALEEDEEFIVSLANPTGGAQLGEPDTAIVTIIDNYNRHGIVQFTKTDFTITEKPDTYAILFVERIEGTDGRILVQYATSDGTAIKDEDYAETKNACSWEDGENDDCKIKVMLHNDDLAEEDETFTVYLHTPMYGAEIGSPDTATVTIKDDDKSFNCKKVIGIPKKECQALIALYDSTDGDNWTDNTGWKETKKPCKWYGVDCQNKNITGIDLKSNNLEGTITKKLTKLKKLEALLLNDNKLTGEIPKSLTRLKKMKSLDLSDNCLDTNVSKKLKKWLDKHNPGWNETQTNCQ
jgi:Leucine-rich repeat (LRR) protein